MEDAETLAERVITAMFDAFDVGVGADSANDRLTGKELVVADGIAGEANNQVVVDLLKLFGSYHNLNDWQYYSKAIVQNYFKNFYFKQPTEESRAHAETVIAALEEYVRVKAAKAIAERLNNAFFQAAGDIDEVMT